MRRNALLRLDGLGLSPSVSTWAFKLALLLSAWILARTKVVIILPDLRRPSLVRNTATPSRESLLGLNLSSLSALDTVIPSSHDRLACQWLFLPPVAASLKLGWELCVP